MFGHDYDGTAQSDNQGMTPAEPTDDGTLGAPMTNDTATTQSDDQPAADQGMPLPQATSLDSTTAAPMPGDSQPAVGDNDLMGIKQEVLQSLKPLVGHLEQTPEEKFRTTMMMIQAADDQSLIPQAYEAAKSINDEKARAQALLDVVNEINYFTTQGSQDQ